MRTVPILAGGILLVLAFGTATAVAATNDGAQAEAVRVVVDAAPEPTVEPAPVVTVAPVATTEPELTWSAPTAEQAPELTTAPGVEAPTYDPATAIPDPAEQPIANAPCTTVVPQSLVDAYQAQGSPLYAVMAPDPTYFPWIGTPADELQIMTDHWITNCTWNNMDGESRHVDFGAGLDAADIAVLQERLTAPQWTAVTLSTGDVLHIDAAEAGEQFPETDAWLLQGDRWMRIDMMNDTDAAAFAETLLASGLTWP